MYNLSGVLAENEIFSGTSINQSVTGEEEEWGGRHITLLPSKKTVGLFKNLTQFLSLFDVIISLFIF